MDDKEHTYFNHFAGLPRLTVLPWYLWALIAVVAIWATSAAAEEVPLHVFEDEAVSLQLFSSPCENEKAKSAAADSPLNGITLQRATSNWGVATPLGLFRLDFDGCWAAYTHNGKQGYAVAFEDGEVRFFPTEGFKKTKGTVGA